MNQQTNDAVRAAAAEEEEEEEEVGEKWTQLRHELPQRRR